MKATVFLIGAFLGIIILSSCSNDDDETSAPKDNSWYWGYFNGTINGKEIAVENVGHGEWPVRSIGHSIRNLPKEENEPDSVKGLTTGIWYHENEGITVNLYHLYKGTRYIINSAMVDFNYDGIQITRKTQDNENNYICINYIPKPEKPFCVEITNATYIDGMHPVLEAELDGVLYRSDNSKDSIVVKGSFGTR